MKKFSTKWLALFTTMTLLVGLFTCATPVSAKTFTTYTEDFENYASANGTTWTYEKAASTTSVTITDGDVAPSYEVVELSDGNNVLKVSSGNYTVTGSHNGSVNDKLKISVPGVNKNSKIIDISFDIKFDGDTKRVFERLGHIGGYSRDGYRLLAASTTAYKWNSNNNNATFELKNDSWRTVRLIYDITDPTAITVDFYVNGTVKGTDMPVGNVNNATTYAPANKAVYDALTGDSIEILFAASAPGRSSYNGNESGTFTYLIDNLKVVGAEKPVTGAKEYTQDFSYYGEYDEISYNYTLAETDNGGSATVANYPDTENKALKIVSKTTSTTATRDKLKIQMPGMPEDVDQIEVYFDFCYEGTGRKGFYNFASVQDNQSYLAGKGKATVGVGTDQYTHINMDNYKDGNWLKVHQVYNLKDNTFSIYTGENDARVVVANKEATNPTTFNESLTADTINLYFGTTLLNNWGTGTGDLTYWIDNVRIVGSTLPDEILYNEEGTRIHTGAITGGTTVTVKVSDKEYADYVGFAALKNKVTGDLARAKIYTPANLDGITLTAPEDDGTYIVEIYYFGSLNTLKPLCNKITLGNVEY